MKKSRTELEAQIKLGERIDKEGLREVAKDIRKDEGLKIATIMMLRGAGLRKSLKLYKLLDLLERD